MKSATFWKVLVRPRAATLWGFSPVMSSPSRRTRPAVGLCRPTSVLNSVDLPAPFGPMSPTISPLVTSNETASTACSPPKRLLTP